MIFIVIPVHNRKQTTLECLQFLHQQTIREFIVVVVDDGSTDGTSEAIQTAYPDAVLLRGNGTLWWAGAMCKGVEYALAQATDADYILSLNDDVTMEPTYLEELLSASVSHHSAVVGSLCRDSVDHAIIHDAGITIQWKKYVYGQVRFNPEEDVVTNVDTISGRGVLIPVPVFKKIGNFAADILPHYGADYEFGFRVKSAGIPLVVANKAPVYLRVDLTGFIPKEKIVSYRDSWKELFFIKSPSNISVHLHIIWRHCPGLFWKLFDVAYLIAGRAYVLVKNTVLYTLLSLRVINRPDHA